MISRACGNPDYEDNMGISAVCSATLLFTFLESTMCKLPTGEISIFQLVSVAEETGLELALSETSASTQD